MWCNSQKRCWKQRKSLKNPLRHGTSVAILAQAAGSKLSTVIAILLEKQAAWAKAQPVTVLVRWPSKVRSMCEACSVTQSLLSCKDNM